MKLHSRLKHVLGVSACGVCVYFPMLGVFRLAISTFHNGPASAFSYSQAQQSAAIVAFDVYRVLLWPGFQVTKGGEAFLVSSAAYGIVLYGVLLAFRRLWFSVRHGAP